MDAPNSLTSNVTIGLHKTEPHTDAIASRLNWLRAGVMGANDGIVSIAGLVVGVADASPERSPIFTAGIAGVAAGAVSMALGEYVSVSTQRDTERVMLAEEKRELEEDPEQEFAELAALYQAKGLSAGTALTVAHELTERDAFAAHVDIELGINPDNLTNPWHAAFSSAVSFTVGALLPLIAILISPVPARIPITFGAVLIALALAGTISAQLGRAARSRAVLRIVAGGAIAMMAAYAIGHLIGGPL